MRLRVILFSFIALVAFSLAAKNVYACTNPAQIPSGFAVPCPVFNVTPTSTAATGSVTVTATPGNRQYISEEFYVYNGYDWSQLQFQGVFGPHGYATSTVSYTLSSSQLSQLPSGIVYLAEWDWTYNKSLNCFVGPSSTACSTGYWRVQEFSLTGGSGGGGGGPEGGPLTYPGARTDLCETASSTCNAPTGEPDSPMSFLGENTTTADGSYLPLQNAPTGIGGLDTSGAQQCVTDPDFGAKICRVTNASMGSVGFNAAEANTNLWASDGSKFLVYSDEGSPHLFSFSDDNNMVSTESDIGGVTNGGSATTFADGGITFSNVNPNVLYELEVGTSASDTPVVLLNKLVINDSGAPSTWTLTRTQMFDFEEGNPGHPPGSCLKYEPDGKDMFMPNWHGTLTTSNDDQAFQISFSDDGQDGIQKTKNGQFYYGATFVAAYNPGLGCRVLDTNPSFSDTGPGPMTITGDWGYTGPVYNGAGMPIGQTGGQILPDVFAMHDSGPSPNDTYSDLTGSWLKGIPLTSSTASCVFSGKPSICENYEWETATGNIRPVYSSGHSTKGYLYVYKGKEYSAYSYASTTSPGTPLLAIPVPVDQHGSYNNADDDDDQPVFLMSTNVCDQAPGTQGAGDCDPEYTGPLYDEIFAVQNVAAHPQDTDCVYGGATSPCVYRIAHTFNTGTNWNFDTQNAEGEPSPTGQFFLFASDWNMQLGCTNGQASGCIDSITASTNNYCVANAKTEPCQRGDVFVVEL